MRYLRAPEKLPFKDPTTGKIIPNAEIDFQEFVRGVLLDKRFNANYKTLLSAQRIEAAAASTGGIIAFEQSDWELLKECAGAPVEGYRPGIGVQMIPFIKAILEASEEKPD